MSDSMLYRAILALLVSSAPCWAMETHAVELEAESYLHENPYGMIAKSAAGGPKGWLSLRAMAWYPALSGTGNDDGGGVFDLREDLGIKDNELLVVPQITFNFWIFGFRTDYFDFESSGNGTLTRSFTFGGITFAAGENVSSDVRLQNSRSFGFLRFLDTDHVRLFGLIGFNYYKYEATITSQTLGTATVDGSLPFPVIGLLVQVRVSDFLFEAEASGFYVDYSDIDATAIDITVSAAWSFLKFGELRAGYRWVSLDGTIDDTSLDLRLDGFFLSVGVNF